MNCSQPIHSPQQPGEASRSCRVRELHQNYEESGQKSIHDPRESRSRKSGSVLKMSIWLWVDRRVSLTPVSDAVPESAQSGGGELVQGVPSHLVPLAPDIEDHWAWRECRCKKISNVTMATTFIFNGSLNIPINLFWFLFSCFVIFNFSSPPRNLFATMRNGEGGCSGTSGGPGVSGSPMTWENIK